MDFHRGKTHGELGYRFAKNFGPMASYLHNIAISRGWKNISMYRSPSDTKPGTIVIEFDLDPEKI